MKTALISRFRPAGLDETLITEYGVECYYSESLLKAIMYLGKSNKQVWFYRFRSHDEMWQRINETAVNYLDRQIDKGVQKMKERKANADFNVSQFFKVGDVVLNSWGYEQTNIDFYQVVSMTAKKINVKEIRASLVQDTGNSMAGHVTPIKDAFVEDGKELSLLVKARVLSNGEVDCHICNPESYYYFHKYDGRPKYCSWYA